MTAAGKITQFNLSGGTIGDSAEPTSDTIEGKNGLYGNGTVYISATGASNPSTSIMVLSFTSSLSWGNVTLFFSKSYTL